MRLRIHSTARGREDLRFFLGRLVDIDVYLIRKRRLPPLYQSGVRYVAETEDFRSRNPVEDWQAADEVVRTGEGDCEDLACYRCAELRLQGVDAHPRLTRHGRIWHVTVLIARKHAADVIEDPSRRLGMKGVA